MKSILSQSVLSGGIKVASAGLIFLMFIFLARALGPEEYGRFGTMFSLGSFLAYIVCLGQPTRVIKHLPGWLEVNEFGYAKRLITQSISAVCLAGLAISFALYLASVHLPWPNVAALCLGAMPFVLPFALADLFASLLRVFGLIGQALLPRDVIWRILIVVLASGSGIGWLTDVSAQTAMTCISAILLVLVAVQVILFSRVIPKKVWHISGTPLPQDFWHDSSWFWMASLVGIMANHLAVVFTSISLSDVDTGAFFAASKIAQLVQLPLMAVNIVMAPMISRLFAQGDLSSIQDTCRSMAPFLLLVSLFCAAVLFIAPAWFLEFFDPAYAIAAPALVLLVLGQLFAIVCGPVGIMMLMTNGERQFLILTGLSEGLGLLLVLALAPSFGLVGAAFAGLIGKVGWNALAVIWCRQKLGVDPSALNLLRRTMEK